MLSVCSPNCMMLDIQARFFCIYLEVGRGENLCLYQRTEKNLYTTYSVGSCCEEGFWTCQPILPNDSNTSRQMKDIYTLQYHLAPERHQVQRLHYQGHVTSRYDLQSVREHAAYAVHTKVCSVNR